MACLWRNNYTVTRYIKAYSLHWTWYRLFACAADVINPKPPVIIVTNAEINSTTFNIRKIKELSWFAEIITCNDEFFKWNLNIMKTFRSWGHCCELLRRENFDAMDYYRCLLICGFAFASIVISVEGTAEALSHVTAHFGQSLEECREEVSFGIISKISIN